MRLFDFDESSDIILHTQLDFGDDDFLVFDEPLLYFDIRTIWSRISSFPQLTHTAEVFLYLNPDIEKNIFTGVFRWLADRENGRTVRTYSKARVNQMTDEVYRNRATPYCRRMRRVVFNPDKVISKEQKIQIAGQVTKRANIFTATDIYAAADLLERARVKITASGIASHLGCSVRTVSRLLDNKMKEKFKEVNKEISRENKIQDVIEWIAVLIKDNNMKIRELKKLTSVRDYSIIKEAMSRYEQEF